MLTNEKIEVKCDECNVSFLRLKKEYVRSQKLRRKSFCSVKCSGKKNGSAKKKQIGSTPLSPAKENISMKEIELLQFPWKTFTLVEVIANTLSNLKEKVLCSLTGKHSWKILISNNWQISRVNSVNSFRNKNASNLKCKHCNITKHFTDAELNHTENLYYNWYTDIEFSYSFHQD